MKPKVQPNRKLNIWMEDGCFLVEEKLAYAYTGKNRKWNTARVVITEKEFDKMKKKLEEYKNGMS